MKLMQCWDDGVHTDIRLVGLLRRVSAKATFNINPGLAFRRSDGAGWKSNEGFEVHRLTLDEMKDLFVDFKVAGHSMTHPTLTRIPIGTLRIELAECKRMIHETFGQERCGFAYPCREYNDRVKAMVREAGYLYARTAHEVDGALPLDDPMELRVHCHFQNPDFWKKFERVRALDGVFYFWGHSFEMMEEPSRWDELERRLERMSRTPGAEWMDVIDLFPPSGPDREKGVAPGGFGDRMVLKPASRRKAGKHSARTECGRHWPG